MSAGDTALLVNADFGRRAAAHADGALGAAPRPAQFGRRSR